MLPVDAFGLSSPAVAPMSALTFSQWLQAIVVRSFAPFIPSLVKQVYEALELEDVIIDLDLNHHSQPK